MGFFNQKTEPLGRFVGKIEYMIEEPLVFQSDICGEIFVPAQTVTDFASIPRIFWRILPPWDVHRRAAIVHDYLYSTQKYSRKVADMVFLEAMENLGVGRVKASTMYRALRMFGWAAWNAHARRIKSELLENPEIENT